MGVIELAEPRPQSTMRHRRTDDTASQDKNNNEYDNHLVTSDISSLSDYLGREQFACSGSRSSAVKGNTPSSDANRPWQLLADTVEKVGVAVGAKF
ncbi:hypothetical protein FS827_08375 [Agrobacterium vitis]|uniref:hypothetical protein n=1 Tax=Allorhizobium ampelinum TaxID=3025782 RepID=UPI001F233943|nr:hypothetical protein [Allorhizobium ampelinum]MCF1461337.1 hypothetical protein [Allorhizobium ampelinum]